MNNAQYKVVKRLFAALGTLPALKHSVLVTTVSQEVWEEEGNDEGEYRPIFALRSPHGSVSWHPEIPGAVCFLVSGSNREDGMEATTFDHIEIDADRMEVFFFFEEVVDRFCLLLPSTGARAFLYTCQFEYKEAGRE